jgi:hypothetical protein
MLFDANGHMTMPTQPCVLVNNAATIDNVTGDGTVYTGIYATEIKDQNADWDGVSTFTAPVTGTYLVTVLAQWNGITSAETKARGTIVASNRSAYFYLDNPYDSSLGGSWRGNGAVFMDMDASDTLTVTGKVSNGTKVVDFDGSAALSNTVSIVLLA